MITVSCAIK